MPDIVKLEQGVHGEAWARAAAWLGQGDLIALRTASGFRVIGRALEPKAIQQIAGLPGLKPWPTLVLGQARAIGDWLPYCRGAALRLMRRFWPGPLNFLGRDGYAEGLWQRLPAFAKSLIHQAGGLALTVADTAITTTWTTGTQGPLIQSEASAEVASAEQAGALWGSKVGLIIDTPVSPHGSATWVALQGQAWRVIRAAAIPQAELDETAPCRIVFVCTGNTCRSPLAAALCRKLLADRLGCPQADLTRQGFCVQSAGLAAMMGGTATPEAVVVAQAYGAELVDHQSRPLNLDMVAGADLLLTMTQSHLGLLESLNLDVGPRPQLLSSRGDDVDDPIGGGPEIYQACAGQLLAALQERLPEFLES